MGYKASDSLIIYTLLYNAMKSTFLNVLELQATTRMKKPILYPTADSAYNGPIVFSSRYFRTKVKYVAYYIVAIISGVYCPVFVYVHNNNDIVHQQRLGAFISCHLSLSHIRSLCLMFVCI